MELLALAVVALAVLVLAVLVLVVLVVVWLCREPSAVIDGSAQLWSTMVARPTP
jgi:hypothetical protein